MILKINDVIGIILIIVIIIIYKFKTKNLHTDHFAQTTGEKKQITTKYGLHISAVRNMAQLAAKALNGTIADGYTLYLPINNIKTGNIIVNIKTEINGDLKILNSFKATKINEFEKATATTIHFDLYPRFMIIPWGGDINKLPKNWFICDGSSYVYKKLDTPSLYDSNSQDDKIYKDTMIKVPDMRDRFILNVNEQTYTTKEDIENNIPLRNHQFNSTGGSMTEILDSNNIPLHNHYFNLTTTSEYLTYNKQPVQTQVIRDLLGVSATHSINTVPIGREYNNGSIDLAKIGIPQNDITISNTKYNIINTLESASVEPGNVDDNPSNYDIIWDIITGDFKFNHTTQGHENMPPYYKLCYIIKL